MLDVLSKHLEMSKVWMVVKPSNAVISSDGKHRMSGADFMTLQHLGHLKADEKSSLFDVPQVYHLS